MKRKTLLELDDRVLTKNDFNRQLLHMIVVLKLSFASLSNIELQRTFSCLNNTIKFSSFFTIKNHLLLRAQKIQTYVSKWSESIRFRLGFCHLDLKPARNQTDVDLVWVDLGSFRFRLESEEIQKLLRLSLRYVANIYIYIYMHILYAACAHEQKKFLFAKFIELDRSSLK